LREPSVSVHPIFINCVWFISGHLIYKIGKKKNKRVQLSQKWGEAYIRVIGKWYYLYSAMIKR